MGNSPFFPLFLNSKLPAMDFRELMRAEKAAVLRESLLAIKVEKSSVPLDDVKSVKAKVEASLESSMKSLHGSSKTPISHHFNLQISRPLQDFKLDCPASSVFYLPSAILDIDSHRLLEFINSQSSQLRQTSEVPETLSLWRTLGSDWTHVKGRKLQQWGKLLRGSDDMQSNVIPTVEPENVLPPWLHSISQELVRLGIFPVEQTPNHVLVNEYRSNGGILHHTDGPFYHPNVAILSIGGPMLLTFRRRLKSDQIVPTNMNNATISSSSTAVDPLYSGDLFSVLLQSNSLLVFREELYSDYMHGIKTDVFYDVIDAVTEGGDTPNYAAATCVCLNKLAAGVMAGDRIERHSRTSLTFRCTRHGSNTSK